ncbi:hypothetical protein BDP27DRAFT_1420468 [Rhodocollybia butyracea]|uniref:Uncharacterized protein n=1 Tax=Rhodocollybia butyracea TaxID=206335 RepID=A0A9P5PWY5_9AGAR|nr:hypothetical protein BDP27DRAFT_1420468 [Rhodocollybia butyracea]
MSYRGAARPPGFDDQRIWETNYRANEWRITCKVCQVVNQTVYNAKRHAAGSKHTEKIERQKACSELPRGPPQLQPAVPFRSAQDVITTRMLQELTAKDSAIEREPLPPLNSFPDYTGHIRQTFEQSHFDWSEIDALQPEFSGSRETQEVQALLSYMLNTYRYGPDNINSDEEELDDEQSPPSSPDIDRNEEQRGHDAFNEYATGGGHSKRAQTNITEENQEWFPWPDRTSCTLDILMHLPRSVFSVHQLDLFVWLLRVNGVEDTTSVKTMKELDAKLQKLYGIQSLRYKGAFGHVYYVNSIADIVAQPLRSTLGDVKPQVQPHLSFYPEDVTRKLSEARQFACWANEIPDDELRPMARLQNGDYYIFEPAMLRSQQICMPHRWFKRDGRFIARCWQMEQVIREGNYTSWRVVKGGHGFDVDQDQFLKTFPQITLDAGLYPEIVDVSYIEGNVSKRWNKHNSFLFTPAGLPREESSKEYNIHFLSTSNTAPPLEMLDGIADQISDSQEHGIWTWDSLTQSKVLIILSVLAMLGDNPMQSEFACHIGLCGKYFCRVCKVKGKDSAAADSSGRSLHSHPPELGSEPESDGASVASAESDTSQEKGLRKKKGPCQKFKEGLSAIMERVKAFVKPGDPRNKHESVQQLKSQFTLAQAQGNVTKIKEARTETGLKDTYQNFFIERLFSSYKTRRGVDQKQTALNKAISDLPREMMSPVWRIRGLDPHCDTPVEVLHVVLLGFVKYLWQDVIENHIKKNEHRTKELIIKLNSVNIEGLGLGSGLAGSTLVNHYGSLTGSDFRKIAQIAPFILKGFVPNDCYETWVALSKLIPLIWQPEIEELESYLTTLTLEINYFLACTARWTVQWFNKPKFHILVHLPEHIRRFGPAMLFATEGFESFNAIIRSKSVHSNCQAPSRDIAFSFAKQNRICHMLSGGLFLSGTYIPADSVADKSLNNLELPSNQHVTPVQQYFRAGSFKREHWRQVGPSTLGVIWWSSETVGSYLGLAPVYCPLPGRCSVDHSASIQEWLQTESCRKVPDSNIFTAAPKAQGVFH